MNTVFLIMAQIGYFVRGKWKTISLWSIDRVSNLLVGLMNIGFILMALMIHPFWFLPFALLTISELISVIVGKSLFLLALENFGVKENK